MTFKKYSKIKHLGHEENKDIFIDPTDDIVIQEKMDGANFRFMLKDGQVIFGSRTQELHEDKDHKYAKNFARCIEYVRKNIKLKSKEELMSSIGLIFYGECMVKHTMDYDWDDIPPFLGFDVFNPDINGYSSQAKEYFDVLGLQSVPHIKIVKAGDIKEITDKDVPCSWYAVPNSKDQQAEGIVFKNYSKQIFAKYVRDKFKEENAEVFGGNPKYNKVGDTDDNKLAHMYCTNPRIDKQIFRLLDEGKPLSMELMHYLPNNVYNDIMEEHWRDITHNKKKYKVDFKKLHLIITRRCLAVLRQVITNNALK